MYSMYNTWTKYIQITPCLGSEDNFIAFYEHLDKLFVGFDHNQFNQLDAKGPNQKPFTLVIEPIDMDSLQGSAGKELKVKVHSASYAVRPETIVNYWKKIPYVSSTYGADASPQRTPAQFADDLQSTVTQFLS